LGRRRWARWRWRWRTRRMEAATATRRTQSEGPVESPAGTGSFWGKRASVRNAASVLQCTTPSAAVWASFERTSSTADRKLVGLGRRPGTGSPAAPSGPAWPATRGLVLGRRRRPGRLAAGAPTSSGSCAEPWSKPVKPDCRPSPTPSFLTLWARVERKQNFRNLGIILRIAFSPLLII
jgi:hypothetical protein